MSTTKTREGDIPELQNGDHLMRDEFHRRYARSPWVKKAELVEGIVYMASPVSTTDHGHFDSTIAGWLYLYRSSTPGTMTTSNSTVKLDSLNEFQPDQILYIPPDFQGQSRLKGKYLHGGPEFVCEIAATSASIDLRRKKEVYRRHHVREYLVIRVADQEVSWFEYGQSDYEPLLSSPDGVFRSRQFPGLWLDAKALFANDAPRLNQVLLSGLASPEHAEFVSQLAARKA